MWTDKPFDILRLPEQQIKSHCKRRERFTRNSRQFFGRCKIRKVTYDKPLKGGRFFYFGREKFFVNSFFGEKRSKVFVWN